MRVAWHKLSLGALHHSVKKGRPDGADLTCKHMQASFRRCRRACQPRQAVKARSFPCLLYPVCLSSTPP